jgi:hypothetical protein
MVTIGVLWRLWRGGPVVLRGRWSPRIVRMVVVLLVLLGVGLDRGKAAPLVDPTKKKVDEKPGDELPASVTAVVVTNWLGLQQSGGFWMRFKRDFTLLAQAGKADPVEVELMERVLPYPEHFRALVVADLTALVKGVAPPTASVAELSAALDEMEKAGFFDHWLSAYLWRKTAGLGGEGRIALYARLQRHARVTDALIRAAAQVKPLLTPPRAWMSKAGPKKADLEEIEKYRKSLADLAAAVRTLYPATDAGTWKRDALAALTLVKGDGSLTLHRGGRRVVVAADEAVRFGRLDLFETTDGKEVVLEHTWLGKVALPAGKVVSVWDLPPLLTDEGKKKVRKAVVAALDGDEKAAEQLELALPLTQGYIREGLAETPGAKGAARLRLILTLFDDALMPALADVTKAEAPK